MVPGLGLAPRQTGSKPVGLLLADPGMEVVPLVGVAPTTSPFEAGYSDSAELQRQKNVLPVGFAPTASLVRSQECRIYYTSGAKLVRHVGNAPTSPLWKRGSLLL